MTAADICECDALVRNRPRIDLNALQRLAQAIGRWRRERLHRRLLCGMEPRLLEDIGVDPETIYDANSETYRSGQSRRLGPFAMFGITNVK